MGLIKKLRKAKKEAPPNEKPAVVKTHLRDMIVVPEMIGSVIGIYNGKVCTLDISTLLFAINHRPKVFNSVEIKPEMVGHYLAEFSISYRPVKHGRPGIGATHCEYCRRLSPEKMAKIASSFPFHPSQVEDFGECSVFLPAFHPMYDIQKLPVCTYGTVCIT